MPATIRRPGALSALLRLSSRALAVLGCLLLIGIAVTTVLSVAGRVLFSSPIQGDVELVQLAGAVGIACFLPYTQWQGGNIIVDFFTARAPAGARRRLDAFGALALGAVAALVAWRTAAGALAAWDNEETSMLMAIPVWIPYALMTPGLTLTALVSLHISWLRLTGQDGIE